MPLERFGRSVLPIPNRREPSVLVYDSARRENRCMLVEFDLVTGLEIEFLPKSQGYGDLPFGGNRRLHCQKVVLMSKEIKLEYVVRSSIE